LTSTKTLAERSSADASIRRFTTVDLEVDAAQRLDDPGTPKPGGA